MNRNNILLIILISAACVGMFFARQVEHIGYDEFKKLNSDINMYIDIAEKNDLASVYEEALQAHKQNYTDKALAIICSKLEYLNGYEEYIGNVISNAELMSRRTLFAVEGSYSLKNIIKTKDDYSRIQSINVVFDNDRGIEAFFNYKELYYFIALAAVIIVGAFAEFNSPMSRNITYYCPNGRGRLGIRQAAQLFLAEVLISAIMYCAVLIESLVLYGYSDLNAPVQTISLFKDYTIPISRGEHILVNYVQMCVTIYMFSLIIWVALKCCNASSLGIMGLCLLAGLEVLLYINIEPNSRWELLRRVNLVNVLYIPGISAKYANVNVFGTPFGSNRVIYCCFTMLTVILFIIIVLLEKMKRPIEEYASGKHGNFAVIMHDRCSKSGIFVKELYKLLISRKAFIICMFFFVTAVCFINDSKVHFGSKQLNRDNIYMEIGYAGIEGLSAKYEELKEELLQIALNMSTADARLAQGEIDEEEYMNIYIQYIGRQDKDDLCRRMKEKLTYLEDISSRYGISAVVVPESGYECAIGSESLRREIIIGILFGTAIWTVAVDFFSYERKMKSDVFFYFMKNGGTWLYLKKIAVCVTCVVLFYILLYGYDAVKMIRWYGLPFVNVNAVNLRFMGESGYMGSIGGWTALLLLTRLLLGISIYCCAALLTIRFGSCAQIGVLPTAGVVAAVVYLSYNNMIFIMTALSVMTVVILGSIALGNKMWCRRWE